MDNIPLKTLEILLNEIRVGFLTHFQDGKNVFVFDEHYIEMESDRPTLSLSFTEKKLLSAKTSMLKLPSFFSNLLPEGALRNLISEQLKIHIDDEFRILKALGHDLPGAVIAKPINVQVNESHITDSSDFKRDEITETNALHFSLAGMQMKFSVEKLDGRLTLPKPETLGHYILKTPSNIHADVPVNEYSMMKLAESVGIEIPEVQLIEMDKVSRLPNIKYPNEKYAYVIKRFDRTESDTRIHIEDFAQIFSVRSNEKYTATNYDSMAKLMYETFQNNLEELKKFIARIIFNILIGNTDAHLQNWSVIYHDTINPQLAPAYDLVSTLPYIDNRELALNFAKLKNFYQINESTLEYFAERIGFNKKIIFDVTNNITEKANETWPTLLKELPLASKMKDTLKDHWKKLQSPFNKIIY